MLPARLHAPNGDPNVASLQEYTINLQRELGADSGQNVGLHMTGGVNIASGEHRREATKATWALFQSIGVERTARVIASARCDPTGQRMRVRLTLDLNL